MRDTVATSSLLGRDNTGGGPSLAGQTEGGRRGGRLGCGNCMLGPQWREGISSEVGVNGTPHTGS